MSPMTENCGEWKRTGKNKVEFYLDGKPVQIAAGTPIEITDSDGRYDAIYLGGDRVNAGLEFSLDGESGEFSLVSVPA